jgi:tripartite-type tricarboxylate transporter receptor subunit TctC
MRSCEPLHRHAMLAIATALALCLGATCLGATAALAQDYPSRPVRIVVGFGPGAVADIMARVIGSRMGQTLGQQFVVENRPGAGSSRGAQFVARAPKDGYTLFMSTIANTINPAVSKLSFDFGKDLAPITLVASSPQVLVAHPSLGVSSVRELIALAKSRSEPIHYASSGLGTLSHVSGLLLNGLAGINLVPVQYGGSAQGVNDVIAGRVPTMFSSFATVWPHVSGGRLNGLATTQLKRLPLAPELPTMAEAGVPGYDAVVWMGLLAPAGTPRDVVETLARAANAALHSADVLTPMRAQGFEPIGGSPDDFARHIEAELRKWSRVVSPAEATPR